MGEHLEERRLTPWRKAARSSNGGNSCVEVAAFWRKSTRSGNGGDTCVEVAAMWIKSTHSSNGGDSCVEVAPVANSIAVRDSKDPDGPHLHLTPAVWAGLTERIKRDRI
jgi:hypothetical protein